MAALERLPLRVGTDMHWLLVVSNSERDTHP